MNLKFLSFSLSLLVVAACVPEETLFSEGSVDVAVIEMSKESVTLRETFTVELSAVVRPWNACDHDVEWSSSAPEIAAVDADGVVTAISTGEAVIYAEAGELKGECKVTVVPWRIPAEELDFGYEPYYVEIGHTERLYANVLPETSTDQIQWSVSDESVARISQNGEFEALKEGGVRVTVSAGELSRSVDIYVHDDFWMIHTDALVKPVNFQSFAMNTEPIRVARGETATVQMVVYSENSTGTLVPEVTYFAPQGQNSGTVLQPKMFWLPDIKCTSNWHPYMGGIAPDAYPAAQAYLPDPMIPVDDPEKGAVQLSSGERIPLWVMFDIPRDFAPGIYEGCVKVSGTETAESRFVIQVYNVTLPEKQTMDVIQWINGDELKSMNHNQDNLTPAQNDELLYTKIIPTLCEYGQNSFRLQKYGTPSYDGTYRDASGKLRVKFDFTVLDNEIKKLYEVCPDLHYVQATTAAMLFGAADKGIGKLWLRGFTLDENGELYVDSSGQPDIRHDKQQYRTVVPEIKMYAQQYFMALDEFLKSKTLPDGRSYSDIFLQAIVDEPNDECAPTYEVVSGYIKEAAPDIKIMEPLGTALIGSEYIDFPCPCIDIKIFDNDGIYPWDDTRQTRWIYSAMGPQGDGINRFIRIPLIKTRMMHWLNFRYSAVGYLHWGANHWPAALDGDPWRDTQRLDSSGKHYISGDTWIIWPGYRTVYPSIRASAMRDGIRDYELLLMLEKKDPAKAMELCRKVAINYETHNTDLDNFRSVRKDVLELLEN